MLDGTVVEQVHQFVYLGQQINDNGKCDREIETDRDSKISIYQDEESFNIRTYQSKDKNKNSEVLFMYGQL